MWVKHWLTLRLGLTDSSGWVDTSLLLMETNQLDFQSVFQLLGIQWSSLMYNNKPFCIGTVWGTLGPVLYAHSTVYSMYSTVCIPVLELLYMDWFPWLVRGFVSKSPADLHKVCCLTIKYRWLVAVMPINSRTLSLPQFPPWIFTVIHVSSS